MKYNKLVRDKIPEILDGKGVPYEKKVANDTEYKEELIKKLEEEIVEFKEAGSVEELADILEVVDALKKLPEYANVLDVQKTKREEKGGFEKRLIVSGEK
ncbi:MAG TPA: nucleoside triphosphate pyrophosphohydrolase [Parcubacteria group bacterium]|jgi:predicted house-cleaning noncanonical NTP pyrophosphatase (MazG superfamily)|nr:nucleoside triphosphate pyrophosphohydrolase [Parcubacteria group bacterium]